MGDHGYQFSPETTAKILASIKGYPYMKPVKIKDEVEEAKAKADPIMIKVEIHHESDCCQGIPEPGPDPKDADSCDLYHVPDPDDTCDPTLTEIDIDDLRADEFEETVGELCGEHVRLWHGYEPMEIGTMEVTLVWDDDNLPDDNLLNADTLKNALSLLPVRGYAAKILIQWSF